MLLHKKIIVVLFLLLFVLGGQGQGEVNVVCRVLLTSDGL